jgi:hypothetical protein
MIRRGPCQSLPSSMNTIFMVTILVMVILPCTQCWTVLLKTRETFKLADLYHLQVQIQFSEYKCQRLLVDAATGASFIQIDGDNQKGNNDATCLQSRFQHLPCDWWGMILAHASDAPSLLYKLQNQPGETDTITGWTLDCERWQPSTRTTNTSPMFSKRTLLCAVAQTMKHPPYLSLGQTASTELLLVDTRCKQGIYLLRIHRPVRLSQKDDQSLSSKMKQWSQRPFAYSSATNVAIADCILDSLLHMCNDPIASGSQQLLKQVLLDPTCGSGTFLAGALLRGMKTIGWDCNPLCVQGSRDNVAFLLGETPAQSSCALQVRDSALPFDTTAATGSIGDSPNHEPLNISCVVCNLPWGQNSIDYQQQNQNILTSVRSLLIEGTPCAFITKTPLDHLDRWGYQVVGIAHIPQLDFVRPSGRRGPLTASQGRSDCVVTIARASHSLLK